MKTCSKVFLLEEEMKWENPSSGVHRQIMGYDGQLMMVKVKFDKGAVGTIHEHYHSQATYVVSGKFELSIGSEKKSLALATDIMWHQMSLMDAFALRLVY